VLAGQTNAADLPTSSGCSPPSSSIRAGTGAARRFRGAAVESFDLNFSSASARAGRELGGVIRPNDQRWRPIEREAMEAATVEQFRDFFTPFSPRGRSMRSSSATSSSKPRSRRCGARSLRCRAGPSPGSRRAPCAQPAGAQSGAAPLHPSGRSQPGLCPDRLVDAGRDRAYPRAAGARARRQHVRGAAVRPACASRRARPIRPSGNYLADYRALEVRSVASPQQPMLLRGARTRTAPSGCSSRIGWGAISILRTAGRNFANAMANGATSSTPPADRDRLFDHPADGGRLSPADPDAPLSPGRLDRIVIVAAAGFSAIETWSHATFVQPGHAPGGHRFLGAILLTVSLLVAWSALYYSINYYLLLEEQTDRLLGSRARRAPSWRCCATSSIRTSCSTR
jgi:hypothetical protein